MPPALQFLVLTFAGWVNRHQDDVIAYLRGGESGPPGAPGPSTASPDRRPTPSTRRARPETRPEDLDAGRWYRHPGDDPSLVPEPDRQDLRRQRRARSRPADDATRRGRARGPDGGRESPVGVHTDPRGALEPRPRDRSDHGEADPARPRDRPGSRAEPAHPLADVPAGALGGHARPAICSPSRCSRWPGSGSTWSSS